MGRLIDLSGASHGEGLVRAELVELVAEVIELELLGCEAGGGRDGGVPFEGEMHALMDGVLLGLAGLDEHGVDPELDTCTCAASAGVNQTEREERRARAEEAKGTPLSVRMRRGRPNSRKSLVKCCWVRTREISG
jgi:hypothetical protein